MIYIFDDRFERRKENEVKLHKHGDCVKFLVIDTSSGKSPEDSIVDSIENPECIIFHRSYVFDDKSITFETIRELFVSFDVPIVIFSGGTEANNVSGKEINMNAGSLYENLPIFLEDYRKNGKINLDVLLWGQRYRLNAALKFQQSLAEQFLVNNDLNSIIENLPVVKRSITNKSKNIDFELGNAILSAIDSKESLTWGDLADMIDMTIRNYNL